MNPQLGGNGIAWGGTHPVHGHHPVAHSIHHDQAAAAMALAEAERAEEATRRALESRRELAYLLGRLCLGALFLLSAAAKTVRFDDTVQALSESGMYDAHLLLPLAIAVEVIGAVALAAGYKVRWVAVGLTLYLVGITFLVSFDLSNALNANSALSNLGFIGALLMLAARGAGRASLDRAIERRNAVRYGA